MSHKTKQKNELKDAKTLLRAEGNCRAGWLFSVSSSLRLKKAISFSVNPKLLIGAAFKFNSNPLIRYILYGLYTVVGKWWKIIDTPIWLRLSKSHLFSLPADCKIWKNLSHSAKFCFQARCSVTLHQSRLSPEESNEYPVFTAPAYANI